MGILCHTLTPPEQQPPPTASALWANLGTGALRTVAEEQTTRSVSSAGSRQDRLHPLQWDRTQSLKLRTVVGRVDSRSPLRKKL